MITSEEHNFLEKVNQCLFDIYSIGSVQSPAILKDAYDAYQDKNANSSDSVRSLLEAENLEKAIKSCIKAALLEFDLDN